MSDKLITRPAYVIYVRGKGYIKNKAGEFHKDFEQARLFATEKSAQESATASKQLKKIGRDDNSYVIPVEMTLDPRKLFKTLLRDE